MNPFKRFRLLKINLSVCVRCSTLPVATDFRLLEKAACYADKGSPPFSLRLILLGVIMLQANRTPAEDIATMSSSELERCQTEIRLSAVAYSSGCRSLFGSPVESRLNSSVSQFACLIKRNLISILTKPVGSHELVNFSNKLCSTL